MRSLSLVLLALALPLPAAAQRIIDHTKVRQFMDEEMAVEGPVARVDRGSGGAVWISLGKAHPSATLVIIVPSEIANAFPDIRSMTGAVVRATGRITTDHPDGIGTDPTMGPRMRGPKPKNPFILLENPGRLLVITPAPEPEKKP